jgi:3-oxoacyl-ACP reductase-like protein
MWIEGFQKEIASQELSFNSDVIANKLFMNKLTNKVAYITGGSKGIGYGIAKTLLDAGMKVAITSRSQMQQKKLPNH